MTRARPVDRRLQPRGFPAEAFERLAGIEPGHYWFESRNALIIWALGRYFPNAATMLEIGCGTGFVLQAVHAAFPELQLTASDPMIDGLTIARTRVPSASCVQQDARELDAVEEFDVIGAFDVLEHIPEDADVMRRMYRAVAPRGGVIVTVPQHPRLWSRGDDYGHHVRRYRRSELVGRLSHAGFEIVRVTSFVSLLLPLMAASRWMDPRQPGEISDPELNVSPGINTALKVVLGLERRAIEAGISWPAGGSLLAVARKPPGQRSTPPDR